MGTSPALETSNTHRIRKASQKTLIFNREIAYSAFLLCQQVLIKKHSQSSALKLGESREFEMSCLFAEMSSYPGAHRGVIVEQITE